MAGRAPRRCESSSAAETEAIGAGLAGSLSAGDAVLIQGEIGAGKTTLVRGAGRALGVTGTVNSPTFTIGQRYPAPVAVSHLDLFRVDDLLGEEPELLGDYLGPDTIAFIELAPEPQGSRAVVAEEVSRFAAVEAVVSIAHAGGDRRIIEVEVGPGRGPASSEHEWAFE